MQKLHLKGDDNADAATISDLTFKCCNYEFNDEIVKATIKLFRHVSLLISISVCFWCGPVEVILQTEQTTSSAT
jgi:hypothetical protein